MVLGAAPLVGTGLGLLLGFVVSAVVMMALFDTTFGKALAANILAWVLPFVVATGIALIAFALMGLVFAFRKAPEPAFTPAPQKRNR